MLILSVALSSTARKRKPAVAVQDELRLSGVTASYLRMS